MGRVTDALLDYLATNDIDHELDDETGAVAAALPGPPGTVHALLPVEASEHLVYWAVLAAPVPEPRRPAMAEFLCRANYGLLVGNLEMDWDDGEVRCKTGLDVADTTVSGELITGLIRSNLAIVDRYTDAILAVASGDADPAAAVAAAEQY